MTTEALLQRTAGDLSGRLRWRVMQRLGISPASLQGLLLSRRRALRLACQMVLDAPPVSAPVQVGSNPNFDMERFLRLSGGGTR